MSGLITQPRPTMYFLGVTTAQSSSRKLFPLWADRLGLRGSQLVGVDLPIHGPPALYRQAIDQIKEDPLSLGATITTHKITTLQAAGDLFDELTDEAATCREVSCVYKRGSRLIGDTTDLVVAGKAMAHFLGNGYWQKHHADVMCIGAGGTGVALTIYFVRHASAQDRPRRMVIIDRDPSKLANLQTIVSRLPNAGMVVEFMHNAAPTVNDHVMATLPPHSMVVNATGMGKDLPGSPITPAGVFPQDGVAWELNYRGDLDFFHQARAQSSSRRLHVEDGWWWFLLGWTTNIGLIFDVEVTPAQFEQMAQAASALRT